MKKTRSFVEGLFKKRAEDKGKPDENAAGGGRLQYGVSMKYSELDKKKWLCDYSPHGVCLIHVELDDVGGSKPVDWTFEYCNQALAELEGFKSRDELIGKRFYELFPAATRNWLPYYYDAAYNDKYIEVDDISDAVGRYLHVEIIPTDIDGCCLCIVRDIKDTVFERIKKNKELEKALEEERKIKKKLQQALDDANLRNEIISSISKSYRSIYRIDIERDFFEEISNDDETHKLTGYKGCASEKLNLLCDTRIDPEYRAVVKPFMDISTLPERLKNDEYVTTEYKMCDGTWQRLRFIVKKRDESGKVTHVLCTVRSSTDIKRRELDLRFQADMAKRENEMKNRLLANISHDIRTPLNGLIGLVNMAEQYEDDPEKLREIRAKTKESLRYLVSFINDILDMSKLQSGELKNEELNFDLLDLLFRANQTYAAKAEEKGISYEIAWSKSSLKHQYLIGNPLYLERVLGQIADNAVKYSSAGTAIEVSLKEESIDESHVSVAFYCKDQGVGMSKEFIERAFDMFTQEQAGSRSTYVGSGLGLAITKSLVDRMGGTIEIDSEPGRGTTIVVKVPFGIGHKDAALTGTAGADISVEGIRVLIAEDNELNREIAKAMLEHAGMDVTCAVDGQEAAEIFEASAPGYYGAIYLDLMMPRLNGYDTARAIRAMNRGDAKHIPIIAMSANAFAEDIMGSRLAGMNWHLAKPLDEQKMVAALKRCLAESNAIKLREEL